METRQSRKRQREPEPEPEPATTLMSLGDDVLVEILRRIPSLPSLARAAFTCPRLRSLASSVAKGFILPPPLLGYFISVVGGDIPSFHRALQLSDRDVAAIVRRGDFHLSDFEDYGWRLMDCRRGLLLLASNSCLTVFDPLSGSRLRIPHYTSYGGCKSLFHCFLLSSGDATSFRVLFLETTGGGRVRPHVYSSCEGEWCSSYSLAQDIRPPRRGDLHSNHNLPMHAGGRLYWRTRTGLSSLDVGSMEFSRVPLPDDRFHAPSYALGDTEDGTTCIVDISTNNRHKLDLRIWFLREEGGSSSSWERQWRADASELDRLVGTVAPSLLKVYNVTSGVVLLSMGYKNNCIRYLAFRLKDTLREGTTNANARKKTKKKANAKQQSPILADFCASTGWLHPCFMAWPRLKLKAAGSTENASASQSEQETAVGSNKKKIV